MRSRYLLLAAILSLPLLMQACAEKPSPQDAAPSRIAASESMAPPHASVAPARTSEAARSDAGDWLDVGTNPLRGASSPSDAVEGLYRAHVERHSGGIPVGSDIPAYRRWLSSRLLHGFSSAATARDTFIAQHPDMKPPYVDGDMFTSLFEGPTAFKVLRQSAESADRMRADVELEYKDRTGSSTWVDHAIVIRESGRWVIDDIVYGGTWDFANHGRLSTSLQDGAAE